MPTLNDTTFALYFYFLQWHFSTITTNSHFKALLHPPHYLLSYYTILPQAPTSSPRSILLIRLLCSAYVSINLLLLLLLHIALLGCSHPSIHRSQRYTYITRLTDWLHVLINGMHVFIYRFCRIWTLAAPHTIFRNTNNFSRSNRYGRGFASRVRSLKSSFAWHPPCRFFGKYTGHDHHIQRVQRDLRTELV